ncbi:MAG TPA: helix-turn-helix transcriptional regulator [Acidimicrobiia bacterium]|nr:helix-turn-helix transcriptional regulator [Acidimicrobiia bacterium]
MTVSARMAKNLPVAAIPIPDPTGLVDMRGPSPVRAGTFAYEGDDLVTGWHHHDLHQVEYAFEGVAEVETAAGHYLLPPQQAIWIPAGLRHQTRLSGVRSVSVFFAADMVPVAHDRARVLAATPVAREMIVYAARWPISRPASDPVADAFFEALALLLPEWLDQELPLSLPVATDPVASAVVEFTHANLARVREADVCRAVGVSTRTLRRRFPEATGMTWRAYLVQSRLLRAMTMLAEPGPSILEVATAVGFESVSAFTRAFRKATGETPSAYRRRRA